MSAARTRGERLEAARELFRRPTAGEEPLAEHEVDDFALVLVHLEDLSETNPARCADLLGRLGIDSAAWERRVRV